MDTAEQVDIAIKRVEFTRKAIVHNLLLIQDYIRVYHTTISGLTSAKGVPLLDGYEDFLEPVPQVLHVNSRDSQSNATSKLEAWADKWSSAIIGKNDWVGTLSKWEELNRSSN